ncbi:hypothetical protein WH52_01950 [Tenacibaculum holothuriorum]|uniref:TonB-dependent receptor n=1 Tax=Tenacibaculum holothuriorum TaxID=1635173 RepID=A0A1Y2PHE3_9FLAO|nr:carboxypeptidase-like regulatory domain-containing protein [Tenacibaculum holothuriorum]OSY89421.1 hypothetical protein WH52_01950 [Tenacibaculum holothuriorum]
MNKQLLKNYCSLKRTFKFLFLLTSLNIYSQAKQKFVYGKVFDDIGFVVNAHVINQNNKLGTYTNENGEFRIKAEINDTIKISSVGYKTKDWVVQPESFTASNNLIEIIKTDYTLDEVKLKKHLLDGILERDMKQTPEDIAIVKSKSALDFSNINFNEPVIKPIDEIDRSRAPDMRKVTDPTAKFAGVGGSISSGPDAYSLKLKKARKSVSYKERFPVLLLSEFGQYFFFSELKIPKEKYYHFLDYCNAKNIESLYKEGKTIEVIKILQQESKPYLELVKNQ